MERDGYGHGIDGAIENCCGGYDSADYVRLSAGERQVLLAAAASPLQWLRGSWRRTDCPVPLAVGSDLDVWSLVSRGLLAAPPCSLWARPTAAGEAEAEAVRAKLGQRTRQLLRQIDEAGELVRRERPMTEEEHWEICGAGGDPAEAIVEWVRPVSAHRWIPDPGEPENPLRGRLEAPVHVCYGDAVPRLAGGGLAILLAGGTRAVLTGAGRWCAAAGPESDFEAGEGRGATGGAQDETASEGPRGPSAGVLR